MEQAPSLHAVVEDSISPGLAEAVPAFSPTFAHLVAAPVPAPADGQLQERNLFLVPAPGQALQPPKSDQGENATSRKHKYEKNAVKQETERQRDKDTES